METQPHKNTRFMKNPYFLKEKNHGTTLNNFIILIIKQRLQRLEGQLRVKNNSLFVFTHYVYLSLIIFSYSLCFSLLLTLSHIVLQKLHTILTLYGLHSSHPNDRMNSLYISSAFSFFSSLQDTHKTTHTSSEHSQQWS